MDPESFFVTTDDVSRFWEAFEHVDWPDTAKEIYLDRASPGLRDFVRLRIEDSENLVEAVTEHYDFYRSIRATTEMAAKYEGEIREVCYRLKELLPEAIFPHVYFLIGRLNCGGTIAESGILVGLEMFACSKRVQTNGLTEWQRANIKPPQALPHIVAHELIHVQQYLLGDPDAAMKSLLSLSIAEGVADFLGEMISGKHINEHVHDWALPREHELWQEYQEVMEGKETTGWLYSTSDPGRPADLGYFFGYRIAKSYYAQQNDKQQAIANLISIPDFEGFLQESNYRP